MNSARPARFRAPSPLACLRARPLLACFGVITALLMGSSPTAQAVVPYPDYNTYQANAYERYAAECVTRLGFQRECAQLLESAIDFNPDRASSHHALAWFYLNSGDGTRALPEFANAFRLDPKLVNSLRAMGDIYAAQGKLSLAEEKYRQYLKEAPRDPMAYYNLGALSVLRGEDQLAIERLKTAVAHGFNDFGLLDHDSRWTRLKDDGRVRELRPR